MSEQATDFHIEVGEKFEVVDDAGRLVDVRLNSDGSVTAPQWYFTPNFSYEATATVCFTYRGRNQFVKRGASDTNGIFALEGSDTSLVEHSDSLRDRINNLLSDEITKAIADAIANIDNSSADKILNH
jgi:hypothetical protein